MGRQTTAISGSNKMGDKFTRRIENAEIIDH